ncbi:MAG: hypothetical protein OXH96_10080 [Spirochaetaceae bacterium]|nr:hypothetical protein [Spirochaetaceae bacterium]
MLNQRQGRFFVRVYDSATRLSDSGEFRYVEGLHEILVDGKPYTPETLLPPENEGHTPIKVQFVGNRGSAIRPSLNAKRQRWVEEERAIVAQPHPDADEVSCTIKTRSGSLDLLIRLPRIWWGLRHDGEESAVWSATPLTMTRSEFRDYAAADATVRVRLPREFDAVDVGFDHDLRRSYRSTFAVEEAARILELPLIDFTDDSPIDSRLSEDTLLRAKFGSTVLILIQVTAEQIPESVSFSFDQAEEFRRYPHAVRGFKLIRDSRVIYRSCTYFDCVKRWRRGDIIRHD